MKNDPSSSKAGQKKSQRLTPAELIRKHLKDPNHHVTDEELSNLKVGVEAEDDQMVSEESKKVEEEVESLPDNDSLPNPYQVLG
jgi:hypothetical protein